MHIQHHFMKPSLWLIILPSTAVSIQFAALFCKQHSQSCKSFQPQTLLQTYLEVHQWVLQDQLIKCQMKMLARSYSAINAFNFSSAEAIYKAYINLLSSETFI